jgi:hypothetical protein
MLGYWDIGILGYLFIIKKQLCREGCNCFFVDTYYLTPVFHLQAPRFIPRARCIQFTASWAPPLRPWDHSTSGDARALTRSFLPAARAIIPPAIDSSQQPMVSCHESWAHPLDPWILSTKAFIPFTSRGNTPALRGRPPQGREMHSPVQKSLFSSP